MRHVTALGIKLALTATVLFSILTIFSTALFSEITLISLVITLATYVIGDLFILPRFGNLIASIADFVMFTAGIWLLSQFFVQEAQTNLIIASLIAAIAIALGEALFHAYMENRVLTRHQDQDRYFNDDSVALNRLQTEFAEEEDIYHLKKHDNNE
ncbi:uncharacterized protein DUF2512 [Anoxybacillus vitaminiphilus]|uniref:Uncharacterized protein DUF2512 n=1 Tax=Paranoxybacillus vitaminiphilus TaxID=581036 RepID=A0A327Y805_9BACL|nr:YndM family protein [Anoxybacillus vitaminiphilus]RAK16601.1 uncharacterized protein DUF2512 [Anoxybacillus vitaminiphilus]